MIQVGDTAKGEDWAWGGKITAINEQTQTVYILVGNQETGEIYPVQKKDCQLYDTRQRKYVSCENLDG